MQKRRFVCACVPYPLSTKLPNPTLFGDNLQELNKRSSYELIPLSVLFIGVPSRVVQRFTSFEIPSCCPLVAIDPRNFLILMYQFVVGCYVCALSSCGIEKSAGRSERCSCHSQPAQRNVGNGQPRHLGERAHPRHPSGGLRVRLHTAGLSIRETVAVLELWGVDHSPGVVWNWVLPLSEAMSDPPTALPLRSRSTKPNRS